MLSLAGEGRFCRTELPSFIRQGQQSLTLQGAYSPQDPGWACAVGCSEILGGGPFCAFPFHFPGADGVLKLWMQCPSFQAPTVSVERMLKLKESVG